MIKTAPKRPHIKNIISKALIVCLALTAFAQAGVVKDHGRLKVKENKIVDSLGNPIQLAGMSLFWPQWEGANFYTANAVRTLVNDWGSTLVRAPIPVYTPNSNPNYQYDDKWISYVKTVIQAAIDNDIYVIVDWHLEGDSPYPEKAKPFFVDIAKTYGKNPHVIFELWNEPINAGWSTIKSYSEDLLKEIRLYSSNLVLVGSGEWSKRLQDPAGSPVIDPGSNVAYAFHFYACTHKQTYRDLVTKYAASIPIFFTEWGTTLASGSGSYCADESDKWLDLAKNLGISWANWSFSHKGGVSGALTSGSSMTSLSQSGIYVKAKIQEVKAALGGSSNPPPVEDTLTLPGKIEAEDFTSSSSELQAEATTDQGGGSNLGYTANGSYATYTVKMTKSGAFTLSARVATEMSGTLTFKWNGATIGTLQVATTGGWQSWQTKEVAVQINNTGIGTLRVEWSGSSSSLVNLNWIELTSLTASSQSKSAANKVAAIEVNTKTMSLVVDNHVREVSIIDPHGRVLMRQNIRSQKNISIPHHARGLIFVQTRSSDGTQVLPVMLSR